MRRNPADFDLKRGLSQNWYFPLQFVMITLVWKTKLGGNMIKFIDRVRDAVLALVDLVAGAPLPAPKLIPIKVATGKQRR